MKYIKYLVLAVAVTFPLGATEYSIIAVSTKKPIDVEKTLFLQRFSGAYIEKQKNYFTYKVGPFSSYEEVKQSYDSVIKYYPDAFIVEKKDSISSLMHTIKSPIVDSNTTTLNNEINSSKLEVQDSKPVSKVQEVLLRSENSTRVTNQNIYEDLYLNTYLSALFENTEEAKELFFQQKIDYLLAEIKQDTYNFDVYVSGTVSTGKYVNYTTNTSSTGAAVNLNANKRLYDGTYSLSDTYITLNKRLADITAINTKDRLAILGTSVYYDLFNSQEHLSLYKKIFDEQKKFKDIIEAKYKSGTSTILDLIDAKNDYVNLERMVTDTSYEYLQNEYVLRQSIHSKSEKAFKLFPAALHIDLSSINDLQKEAIENSSDVAIESNLLKIKNADVLSEKRRFYPTVDFTSSIGYGYEQPKVFDFANTNFTGIWNLGLSVNIPIYNRDDIRLNMQRSTYDALLEQNKFSLKVRDTLNQTQKAYTQLMRIHKQQGYVKDLLELAKTKLDVAKERYLKGLAQYRDYSEALNRVMEYQNELIGIDSDNVKESLILSVLTGKREFYEQN